MTFRIHLFLIAVLGLLVSGYLYVTYVTGAPIICNTAGGCDVVRSSEYASFWQLPTPAYGLIFYFILAVLALLSAGYPAWWVRLSLYFTTGIGVATSAWLTYIEAFVVEAWCIWCVVSALLTLWAWVLVWFVGRRQWQ